MALRLKGKSQPAGEVHESQARGDSHSCARYHNPAHQRPFGICWLPFCHGNPSFGTIYTATLATTDWVWMIKTCKRSMWSEKGAQRGSLKKLAGTSTKKQPWLCGDWLDWQVIMRKVCSWHLSKGAHFIGTNPTSNIPTERGLMPGVDPIVLVEAATRNA